MRLRLLKAVFPRVFGKHTHPLRILSGELLFSESKKIRPFALDEKLTRIDDTSIHKGLRECLANALIHADYYGRRGIVIDKEFRKVTISNPGTFRIDINEAIAGAVSDARNSKIFNMFSLINVGERSGIGLCDVYSAWKSFGYKQPEFIESVDPDRVTLVLNIESEGNYGGSDGNSDGNDDGNLSATEKKIYAVIKENNSISAIKIAERLAVSPSTVERATRKLKKLGYIERTGKTRGSWNILK